MASGTESAYSTLSAAPGGYPASGAVACTSVSTGNPGTASCQATSAGNCASQALEAATAVWYGFTSAINTAWRTSFTVKVQFTHVASSCAECNLAAFDTFYSVNNGSTWARIAQDSLCVTSASEVLSLALPVTTDISKLQISVVQWLQAKAGCSGDCAQAATSVEKVWVEIGWTEPTGSCCTGSSCSVTTQALCVAGGGTYNGDNTTCSPDPCDPTPTGACCEASVCSVKTEAACTGTYLGDGTTCSPDPCSGTTGACCKGSVCIETTEALCNAVGGDYKGDGVLCSSSPCPQTPPAGGLLVG